MPASDNDQKLRRRKILKAAAGAPVVFTLPTGAALAAGSLGCDVKSQNRATTEQPTGVISSTSGTAAADDWMRYKLDGLNITLTDDTVVQGFMLDNSYYKVLADGTVELISTFKSATPSTAIYSALVDYDSFKAGNSASMYVYHGDLVASPIAGCSCWNSLNGDSLISNIIN